MVQGTNISQVILHCMLDGINSHYLIGSIVPARGMVFYSFGSLGYETTK